MKPATRLHPILRIDPAMVLVEWAAAQCCDEVQAREADPTAFGGKPFERLRKKHCNSPISESHAPLATTRAANEGKSHGSCQTRMAPCVAPTRTGPAGFSHQF